ncbi:MAG: hypothetical protein FWD09_00435 [Lentimicrobiaceae bacterium]|nr:hypothetical protein [Lentimicrobiaceae bacterium]
MYKTKEERLYFLQDYQNFDDIYLKHRDANFNKGNPRKYIRCSKESILNSKIIIFKNQKFNYLCLDCDKGISKLNDEIIDFLNQYNIVYFITQGSWTEGKPTDSATLCIQYKNFNNEIRKKLNRLFIVVSRLDGEMTCDPLAIGDQMKSVFTYQMESKYYNREGGNVFDLERLNEIAYSHFNKNWDEVNRLANQYRSESYYQKYRAMREKDFEGICFSKLEKYYQYMSKHNYNNWLFIQKEIDEDFNLIMKKYKSLPLAKKIQTVHKKTLIRDYVLINWCKCDGYTEDLKFFADLLKKKFKITSKRQIYKVAKEKEIQPFNISSKYLDYVSLINDEHLITIKDKLNDCKTKTRKRIKPTKKHKEHKNKGKVTMYFIEKNGKIKEVKSNEKSAYLKRGWTIVVKPQLLQRDEYTL